MVELRYDMTAREVSEALLHITADALMRRDVDAMAAVFQLPQVMSTAQSKIMVSTPEAFARAFHQMCDHFESIGVTSLIRECEVAEFHGRDRIKATHVSHVIAQSQHVQPPYPVFSVIEWIDGTWKIVSSDYALDDTTGQAAALLAGSDDAANAMDIYQEHLDVLSAALMDNDFDAFKARISLPHRITTETDIINIATEAEMKAVFDAYAQTYGNEGLSDFIRIAKEAEFVTPREIVGVHISHKMRAGKRILAPYPNRVRLVLGDDNIWRETHCANAILNDSKNFRLWTRLADTPHLPDLALDPERTPT